MKKIQKHFPGLLILVIATLAILDFSLRAQPLQPNPTELNMGKPDQEALDGSVKGTDKGGGQIPIEPVHLKLFPVNEYVSQRQGLFAESSYLEKNDYIILKAPIQEPLLPLQSVEKNEFNYFLALVKIEENKNFKDLIATAKKKK